MLSLIVFASFCAIMFLNICDLYYDVFKYICLTII